MKTLFLSLLMASVPAAAEVAPHIDMLIRPTAISSPSFAVEGIVSYCPESQKTAFYLPEWTKFAFTRGGAALEVVSEREVELKCTGDKDADSILFTGSSGLNPRKCAASDGEIYCLNRSYPNPEVFSDFSTYALRFDLPEGYGALAPSPGTKSNAGTQFHIAKLSKPLLRSSKKFSFEYIFPEGFTPEPAYLDFMERTLDGYLDVLGDPGFRNVRIGAIRRGQQSGEISGSPAGNLILFSRTALKDKPNLEGLKQLGINSDVTDAMRRMIIAHELSHFWFGSVYLGKDGWMVEGIPNYLGLTAVRKGSKRDYKEILKMFKYMDAKVPKDVPIPNQPFGGNNRYIAAYYQGALALAKVGDEIGHEKLLRFIADVYTAKQDPAFSDFDDMFRKRYPRSVKLWESAWRLSPTL